MNLFVCPRRTWTGFRRCKCGRVAEVACQYPLSGRRAGHFCDAPLCLVCAQELDGVHTNDGVAVAIACPGHARLLTQAEMSK